MCKTHWPLARGRYWMRPKLIVVTTYRRESFGTGFERIREALTRLAGCEDVQLVYPVYRNPNAMDLVYRRLGGLANVFLIEPLD